MQLLCPRKMGGGGRRGAIFFLIKNMNITHNEIHVIIYMYSNLSTFKCSKLKYSKHG